MKTKLLSIVVVAIILAACAPAVTLTPTIVPTKVFTLTPFPPTMTVTPTLTPTPTSTPMGGGVLKVAFISDGCSTDATSHLCLTAGDFFTGKIDFTIPLHQPTGILTNTLIKWSPDGEYFFYQDRTEKQLEVYILNVNTQKAKLLSTHPAQSRRTYNDVIYASWSDDSKRIVYATNDTNNNGKTIIANTDGTMTELDGNYKFWLPDNQTVIGFGSAAYNIQTTKKMRGTGNYSLFAVGHSKNFVVSLGNNEQPQLVRSPQSFSDLDSVTPSEDALINFKTGLKFFYSEMRLVEISDNFVVLGGLSDKGAFSKIIDLRKLPATIGMNDLTGEYPLVVSPDKLSYLSSFCVAPLADLPCKIYDPDLKRVSPFMAFKLWNIKNLEAPVEILLSNDLIQFKSSSINHIYSQVVQPFNLGSPNTLERMDFYWQP